MKIIIVGAGAIGCYITAQFANNTNHEVHLLARSAYDSILKNGITIIEAETNNTFNIDRFKVTNDIAHLPRGDIIIIAIKTSQNKEVLPQLQKLCHAGTQIVTLQNGLNFESVIIEAFPKQVLYSGTCWIKATTLAPGHTRHDFGVNVKLGRYPGISQTHLGAQTARPQKISVSENDRVIAQLFKEAGFEIDLIENIKSVQITKLALNIPFYVLAANKGVSFTEILAEEILDNNRSQIQAEIVAAAMTIGAPVDINLIEQMVTKLRKIPKTAPSIPRDEFAALMRRELPPTVDPLIKLMSQHGIHLEKLALFMKP